MKDNEILKNEYRPEYFVIMDYLKRTRKNGTDIAFIDDIISAFVKKLKKNYFNYIVEYLTIELQKTKPKYSVIDRLTKQLLTELIYKGYSVNYLYNWGLKNFVYGNDPNFFQRLERLKLLGKKIKKEYKCLFVLKLPEKLQSIDTGNEINFIIDKKLIKIDLDKIPDLKSQQSYAL